MTVMEASLCGIVIITGMRMVWRDESELGVRLGIVFIAAGMLGCACL